MFSKYQVISIWKNKVLLNLALEHSGVSVIWKVKEMKFWSFILATAQNFWKESAALAVTQYLSVTLTG